MDFVAIDFETANYYRNSACSIGVVTIKNGVIVDEYYSLIQPPTLEFEDFNISLHGITPDMVKNEKRFNELWGEIYPLINDKVVVAHYAQFDLTVLRQTLDYYCLPYPEIKCLCSWQLSKQAYPKMLNSYSLYKVTQFLGADFDYHNALEDAKACAYIVKKIADRFEAASIDELVANAEIKMGSLQGNGKYKACKIINKAMITLPYFCGKKIAFTGKLKTMTRSIAKMLVKKLGADAQIHANGETDILVTGYQDPKQLKEGQTMSNSRIKALENNKHGKITEIMQEDVFLNYLHEDAAEEFKKIMGI